MDFEDWSAAIVSLPFYVLQNAGKPCKEIMLELKPILCEFQINDDKLYCQLRVGSFLPTIRTKQPFFS